MHKIKEYHERLLAYNLWVMVSNLGLIILDFFSQKKKH